MGSAFDHAPTLIYKNGNFNPFLPAPEDLVSILADLDFSVPVTTSDFSSANATDEWLLQGTSPHANNVGSETLANTAGLDQQSAMGIWDASSYTARKAWETTGNTSKLEASGTSALDSNNTNLCVTVVFRVALGGQTGNRPLVTKLASGGPGWTVYMSSIGVVHFFLDDGPTTKDIQVAGDLADGAWHYCQVFYDAAGELVEMRTDKGSVASTASGLTNSLTNATSFSCGQNSASGSAEILTQYAYVGGAVGAAAATMYAETIVLPGTDPTTGELLTTKNRNSLISVEVAAGAVCHFAGSTTTPQLPVGFHPNFSDTDKLGLYCNTAVQNLIDESEALSNWVSVTMTETDNFGDSPDGFRSATKLAATGANGYSANVFVTSAATEYTISVYIKEITVGCTGRIIFYDETGSVELASQVFTATSDWDNRVIVTATTNGGQVSSSLRVEIDTDTEECFAWGAQAELGAGAGAYIRTAGAAASLLACNYEAAGDYIQTQVGEVEAVAIRTRDAGAAIQAFFGTPTSDQRYAYVDGADRLAFLIRGGGSVEDSGFHAGGVLDVGTEYTAVLQWDVSGESLGFESKLYRNGVVRNGAALPYDQSHGTGHNGIEVGEVASGFQLDGFIQRIRSYDGIVTGV